MTSDHPIISHIQTLADDCKRSLQRKLVVLSGEESWCLSILKHVSGDHFLAVSQDKTLPYKHVQTPEKLHLLLGREYNGIIWNGFSSLNPDGLGIASGLLKGGGLFFLLVPPLDFLRKNTDQDYTRMCSEHLNIEDFNTFFLQRLIDHLQRSNDISIFEEGKENHAKEINSQDYTGPSPTITLPTNDQLTAIDAIKKVAFGHRNRPLVIQANRGRGKSSALGIAAAEIFLNKKFKTIITAPSKKTCEAAFYHYKSHIESVLTSKAERAIALTGLRFLPIDEILKNSIDCHLLLIDEAAAIPTSILNDLVGRFSRVVYATTTHGYEGNGQGFAIRFRKTLDKHFSKWNKVTLTQPIRWLENDTLEPWFFRFLLLDADLNTIPNDQMDTFETSWLSQKELYENEALLEQLISLLVSAHYQTSPSDIRLILDHPKVKILISHPPGSQLSKPKNVLGACLAIEEGAISSVELANNIIAGTRRPRGQLFPQALCASSANPEFLRQSTYRVMRIAVHPSMQNRGVGSDMLRTLKRKAEEYKVDSLSTSYGLSTELLSFWHKNQFYTVKLGAKVDGASGLQSVMMMHAVSTEATQLLKSYSGEFFKFFIFNLSRQYRSLPTPHVSMIIHSLSSMVSKPTDTTASKKKIWAFATSLRALEETEMDLFEWLIEQISLPKWQDVSEDKKELLISQILQNRDDKNNLKYSTFTGKKQRLTALRQAVAALLDTKA